MKNAISENLAPKTIRLEDYTAPDFFIPTVTLSFDIQEAKTRVSARLEVERNFAVRENIRPLTLSGEHLKLVSILLNGTALEKDQYSVGHESLVIHQVPDKFILETEVEIDPAANKALEGLYQSGNIFCTQNEPEGFRRITYFIDRPDVMSVYTTTITAEKMKYPVLLSNGNDVARGDLDQGRHFVTWQDPFKKPCYLFALIAGDLALLEDSFITRSGRAIALRLYVDKGNENRTEHAMASLKKAMKWDEDVFGREYDLDVYMIVAVDAFNQGAMENKGLNIFNSHYILANPETATDGDFENILGVVGHEYFHNWTGNRVTLRDWFQLTLKEGLTVFRDQEFSADMTSRAVKRLEDIRILREYQFVEDAGPMAHPIRPKAYMEINNFYTTTVYEKGAYVIRMIYNLIGRENFRRGMDRYFELYDGQAVTCEDFVRAMELGSGMDLTQFKRWYNQAGTPVCRADAVYDQAAKTWTLTLEQHCPLMAEETSKEPFYFPFTLGLLDSEGREIPLRQAHEEKAQTTRTLVISKRRESFVFSDIPEKPVPSLLRDYSAAVKLEYAYTEADLLHLLKYDQDTFNRYESGQRLATKELNQIIGAIQAGKELTASGAILDALGRVLTDNSLDEAFRAEMLTLPSVTWLVEAMLVCDFDAAFYAREYFVKALARAHEASFKALYDSLGESGAYRVDPAAIGRRALKNLCLRYLLSLEKPEYINLALSQFKSAKNMTDTIASLRLLCDVAGPERDEVLASFYKKWHRDAVVIDKWFSAQAVSKLPKTLEVIRRLEKDPAFDPMIPNKASALYGAFTTNLIQFHDKNGSGYEFIADKILQIDPHNAMTASRFAKTFKKYSKMDPVRKALMRGQMERILSEKKISKAVYEIISKTLSSGDAKLAS